MWLFSIVSILYPILNYLRKKPTIDTLSETMFVFGTNDPLQLIKNYTLLKSPWDIKWRIRLNSAGFFEVYENGKFVRTLRKNYRKVKHTINLVKDTPQQESSETCCRVCVSNRSCIMYEPCGHIGVCNECSYRMNNIAFYTKKFYCF